MNSSFWTRAVTQIGALTIAAFSTSFFATNLIADQLEPPNGNEPKHELAEGHQVLPDSEQDEALRFERIGDDLSREAKTQEALDAYRKALKIRQTLDGQRQSDANERRNLARVYLKVGDSLEVQQFKQHINDVLGTRSVGGVRVKRQQFDFNKNSGIQEAADAFQQSLKIWQSLADSSPSDQIARDGLATALEKLGGIFFIQMKIGDALDAYQRCQKIRQLLAELNESDSARQDALARAYENVGNTLAVQGARGDALENFQHGLKIRQNLVEKDSFNTAWRLNLASAYDRLGDFQGNEGDKSAARDSYQQSVKVLQLLADKDKSNSNWQKILAGAWSKIGDLFLGTPSKYPEALAAYREALACLKRSAELNPSNSEFLVELAVQYDHTGLLLTMMQRFPEAVDAYQHTCEIQHSLVDQEPSNLLRQADLLVADQKLSASLNRDHRNDEAFEVCKESLTLSKNLVESNPSNADFRSRFLSTCRQTNQILTDRGKLDEAVELCRGEVNFTRRIVERYPSDSDWQKAEIETYCSVAKTMARIGGDSSITEAKSLLQKALKNAQEYKGPDSADLIARINSALEGLAH
jgi:tetratricopeptide (TPR) repeat protein